jgi:hypothetical protein
LALNRKTLQLTALAFFLADVLYVFAKPRQGALEIVLDQSLSYELLDRFGKTSNSVQLDEHLHWRTQDGKLGKIAKLAQLTVPNIDSPSYSLLIEQSKPWTFGDAIKVIRKASQEGVCNVIIVDRDMVDPDNASSDYVILPWFTVVAFSPIKGEPVQPCLTDPILENRYKKAVKEYDRMNLDSKKW